MTRIVKIGICALLVGLTCLLAPKESVANNIQSYAVVGVTDGDVLNIRAEPNPRTPKVGLIPPHGRGIVPTGRYERYKKSLWFEIRYRGMEGWVNARYLTDDHERYRVEGLSTSRQLPIHERPGAKTPKIGTLPPVASDLLTTGLVDDTDGITWREIQYGDVTGWVDQRYLQRN